jgi:hypothetical protein
MISSADLPPLPQPSWTDLRPFPPTAYWERRQVEEYALAARADLESLYETKVVTLEQQRNLLMQKHADLEAEVESLRLFKEIVMREEDDLEKELRAQLAQRDERIGELEKNLIEPCCGEFTSCKRHCLPRADFEHERAEAAEAQVKELEKELSRARLLNATPSRDWLPEE